MADQFGGIPIDEAQPQTDQFGGVPVESNQSPLPAAAPAPTFSDHVKEVAKALGHGLAEPWHEQLGLDPETTQALAKAGIFAKGDSYHNPFQAMNELVAQTVVGAGQIAYRAGASALGGYQEAVAKAGEVFGAPSLGRDLAALPEAFFGSPHPTGTFKAPKLEPWVNPKPIEPLKREQGVPAQTDSMLRTQLAKTGDPLIDRLLDLPVMQKIVNEAVLDDTHRVPNSLGGSVPEDNPVLYRDKDFPKTMTIDGVTFDTAHPAAVHENVEEYVVDKLRTAGVDPATALKIGFWDWGEVAEDAVYRAHGLDPDKVEAAYTEHLNRVASQAVDPAEVPKDLFRGTYPDDDPAKAGPGPIDKPTPEESAFGRQIMEDHLNAEDAKKIDLKEAKALGVVGEPPPTLNEGTTRAAAARAVDGDKIKGEPTGEVSPWEKRWQQNFTGKLIADQDIVESIRDAARKNDNFPAARQGDIPLSHVEAVAHAAGMDPAEVDRAGLGRRLRNDDEVRIAIQGMLDVTEKVRDAARAVKLEDTEESLTKLQEAILIRDRAVEQVVGLRAEWGRTGNVIQEFLRSGTEEAGLTEFLKKQGRTKDDLRQIAKGLNTLPRTGAARFLNDMRTPGLFDKFMWYWVNALISGPITHGKYIIANGLFGAYEAGLVTPVAGAIGTARRALKGGDEGVRLGEAGGALWGLVAGVPDAFKGAVAAARSGLQTPLPGESILGIVPKRNKNVFFQQPAIPGPLGTFIGVPSKGASAIHSFFNFLGYRSSIEKQAVRIAQKEGLSVTSDQFWQRRQELAQTPTKDMIEEAIADGYRLTFIKELGEGGKAVQNLVQKLPAARLVMPFTHIPLRLLSEGTEAAGYGFLQKEVRENLSGKNGAVKQDMAIARTVLGTVAGAYVINLAGNDRITGYGPTDPKDRAAWYASGHIPYAVRIGDEWISFNRFGPLGTMFGLHANLAEAIPYLDPDHPKLIEATQKTVQSFGRLLMDEVGMQGMTNIIEAIEDPNRRGSQVVSSFLGSLLPYSSATRQVASAMDPDMREAKTVVDGLRYYIPGVRQTLLPRRDWSGAPIPNSAYGGDMAVPGLSALMQHHAATVDPVVTELGNLGIKPAPPTNRVGGVQLPPGLYDRYQQAAGALTRSSLEMLLQQPGWSDIPVGVREKVFREAIRRSREAAGAMLQAQRPDIVETAQANRMRQLQGRKPLPASEEPPDRSPVLNLGVRG